MQEYLEGLSSNRLNEANELIGLMQKISGEDPVLWGPSIIGFGKKHYKYDSGHEGDIPKISFSPRKASITIYFSEGFDRHYALMQKLGKYKASVSCLYINKLNDIDIDILKLMLIESYKINDDRIGSPITVEDYVKRIPEASRAQFDELRGLVKNIIPHAEEVLSYGIVGYKLDEKRARVFISGWKDHVAIYPIPKDPQLTEQIQPYIKGKGTLWFSLDKPLPKALITKVVKELIK
jgi:uncharacterized protein YdhG (YjbR/CyaY superfamily)